MILPVSRLASKKDVTMTSIALWFSDSPPGESDVVAAHEMGYCLVFVPEVHELYRSARTGALDADAVVSHLRELEARYGAVAVL